jgi:radical SAM enzyme (TIGR01210 family)
MAATLSAYPEKLSERDRWVLERRGERAPVTSDIPYAFLLEQERFADGELDDVATIFLTNRECPWRCVMCDLWRNTLLHPVAADEIPRQIEYALKRLPPARQIKLYNSGSFFDRGAIPLEDHAAIAALLRPFERVIVECHPALVGESCLRFNELIEGRLEVAMGLETAHPGVLQKLNKRMTLEQYAAAASRLQASGIALRSFVLVQPPFMAAQEALFWACRSIDFAQNCGATVVSLIPTRGGNGAMDELARAGDFVPPLLSVMEDALDYGVGRHAGRVFLDLWDFDRVASCSSCRDTRKDRLHRINMLQTPEKRIACVVCGGAA